MKNAIILHGTGDSPKNFWFPYLKKELEKQHFDVWLPSLPNPNYPNLKDWLPFLLENGKYTRETILIGHSAGAQIILSVLEKLDIQIQKAILVSGYAKALRKDMHSEKNVDNYNWKKIQSKAKQFIFINSDNDPWGCNDAQGRIMFDHLGGMQIILHEGHMGSTTHKQPYKRFPLLLKLI